MLSVSLSSSCQPLAIDGFFFFLPRSSTFAFPYLSCCPLSLRVCTLTFFPSPTPTQHVRARSRTERILDLVSAAGRSLPQSIFAALDPPRRKQKEGEKIAAASAAVSKKRVLMASQDAGVADGSLLKKHSQIISVVTERYSYPGVRVFYRAHPKAALLPPGLPLVVFIHGNRALARAPVPRFEVVDVTPQVSGVRSHSSST